MLEEIYLRKIMNKILMHDKSNYRLLVKLFIVSFSELKHEEYGSVFNLKKIKNVFLWPCFCVLLLILDSKQE